MDSTIVKSLPNRKVELVTDFLHNQLQDRKIVSKNPIHITYGKIWNNNGTVIDGQEQIPDVCKELAAEVETEFKLGENFFDSVHFISCPSKKYYLHFGLGATDVLYHLAGMDGTERTSTTCYGYRRRRRRRYNYHDSYEEEEDKEVPYTVAVVVLKGWLIKDENNDNRYRRSYSVSAVGNITNGNYYKPGSVRVTYKGAATMNYSIKKYAAASSWCKATPNIKLKKNESIQILVLARLGLETVSPLLKKLNMSLLEQQIFNFLRPIVRKNVENKFVIQKHKHMSDQIHILLKLVKLVVNKTKNVIQKDQNEVHNVESNNSSALAKCDVKLSRTLRRMTTHEYEEDRGSLHIEMTTDDTDPDDIDNDTSNVDNEVKQPVTITDKITNIEKEFKSYKLHTCTYNSIIEEEAKTCIKSIKSMVESIAEFNSKGARNKFLNAIKESIETQVKRDLSYWKLR